MAPTAVPFGHVPQGGSATAPPDLRQIASWIGRERHEWLVGELGSTPATAAATPLPASAFEPRLDARGDGRVFRFRRDQPTTGVRVTVSATSGARLQAVVGDGRTPDHELLAATRDEADRHGGRFLVRDSEAGDPGGEVAVAVAPVRPQTLWADAVAVQVCLRPL